jgi:hypothetical protein
MALARASRASVSSTWVAASQTRGTVTSSSPKLRIQLLKGPGLTLTAARVEGSVQA